MPVKDVDFSTIADNNVDSDDKDSKSNNNDGDQDDSNSLDDFFAVLDRDVNGAVFDDGQGTDNNDAGSQKDAKNNSSGNNDNSGDTAKELENLKKRYEASSEEAKRLSEKIKKLEPYENYLPILNAMRQDPGLIDHVKQYLSGNTAPVSVKERLGLSEDFEFDISDAIDNPGSDSGKLFGYYVNAAVDRKVGQYQQVRDQEDSFREQQKTFQEQHKIKNEEMNELEDWAKSHQLSWEDIYYLKNRDKREKEIVRRVLEEREKQLNKMRGVHKTLAATGAPNQDFDTEEEIFKGIERATGGADIFSNMK